MDHPAGAPRADTAATRRTMPYRNRGSGRGRRRSTRARHPTRGAVGRPGTAPGARLPWCAAAVRRDEAGEPDW